MARSAQCAADGVPCGAAVPTWPGAPSAEPYCRPAVVVVPCAPPAVVRVVAELVRTTPPPPPPPGPCAAMLPAPGAWVAQASPPPAAVRVQGGRAEPAGQGGQHDRAAGAPAAPAVVGGELVGVGTVGRDGAGAGDPARTDEHDAAAGRTVGVGRGEVVRGAGAAAAAEQRARPGRRHRCTTPAAGGLVGVPGVAAHARHAPPLPPPPPPEFSSLAGGFASVPPPPALPGAPRAASPPG